MPSYFILFLFIAELVIFIGHYVVYKAVEIGLNIQSIDIIWALRYIFSLLSISFVVGSIYTRYANNVISRTVYRLAAAWMGFFVYLFPASVIILLYYSALLIFGINLHISVALLSIILFVIAIGLGVYGLINAQRLQIKKIDLSLPNLPAYWKGKRVVFLSDTHFGQVRNISLAKTIVDKINSVEADLVLHAGDFFDGVHIEFAETAAEFAKIKSTHGIFFATGNHESFEDDSIYTKPLKEAGINVLNNEICQVEGLNIIGAEYSKTESLEQFTTFVSSQKIDHSKPHILLKHVPNALEVAEKAGIALTLSGHTHRGQLWPFRYITRKMFKGYDYGLKKFGQMQVYTSSGAGTWGPPLKVFTAAEIIVFTLQ